MKRILLAAAFALAIGGPARAADLPPPPGPAPKAPSVYLPAAPVYNWSGVYLGINGGYGFGTSNWNAPTGSTGNFNTNGFLAGATLGANYQTGAFVFGVEGDIDWNNLSGSSTALGCGIAPVTACQTAQTWLGTARGRVGYAFDRILVYGTGGGAFGNILATVNGSGLGTSSNNEFGWTAGAGVEAAFAPNWTAKIEYLYVSLANGSCGAACGAFGSTSVSLTENLVRAGINYKFNW